MLYVRALVLGREKIFAVKGVKKDDLRGIREKIARSLALSVNEVLIVACDHVTLIE